MRWAVAALLGISLNAMAAQAPLRFAVPDSWAMPMVQLQGGRPTQGILHDVLLSLATQVGAPAQFVVLPRARVQSAMEHGDIDVRCYAAQSWLPNQSGDYIWSVPLWFQRDLLISRKEQPAQINPASYRARPSAPFSATATLPCNRCSTPTSCNAKTRAIRNRYWKSCWPGDTAMR